MQTTAQQMSSTAEETSRQSASVASASDQAATNVETVAVTAEELSASIVEIGRQVDQAANIASNAAAEAESTNTTVHDLATAAAKIGDVVQKVALARWSRTFSGTVSSGVPILQAIEITGKTAGNHVVEKAMADGTASGKSGGTIAAPPDAAGASSAPRVVRTRL